MTQVLIQGLAVFLLKRYRDLPRQRNEFARRSALPCALALQQTGRALQQRGFKLNSHEVIILSGDRRRQ